MSLSKSRSGEALLLGGGGLGNNLGFLGRDAEASSSFLSGATNCYGVVVSALLPVIIWLIVVILWRYLVRRVFPSTDPMCCCTMASHDVADEASESGEDANSCSDNDDGEQRDRQPPNRSGAYTVAPSSLRQSSRASPSAGEAKRAVKLNSLPRTTDCRSCCGNAAGYRKWFRAVVSEHTYLSAVFPCNASCAVTHPVELLSHLLVVITLHVLLSLATKAEFEAMRIVLGAVATFLSCFVRTTMDIACASWIGRGHDNKHWVSGFTRVVVEWAAVVTSNTKGQGDADRVMSTIVEMLELDLGTDADVAEIQHNGQRRRSDLRLPLPPPPPPELSATDAPHTASVSQEGDDIVHHMTSDAGDIDVDEIDLDDIGGAPLKPIGLGEYVAWLATEAVAADDIYSIPDVTTDDPSMMEDRSKSLKKSSAAGAGNAIQEIGLSTASSGSSETSSVLSWARPRTVDPSASAFIGGFDFSDDDEQGNVPASRRTPPPRAHQPPVATVAAPRPPPRRSTIDIRKDVVRRLSMRPRSPEIVVESDTEEEEPPVREASELGRILAAYDAWHRRCRMLKLPFPWWSVDESVRSRYIAARVLNVVLWVALSYIAVVDGLQKRVGVSECSGRLAVELPIVLIILDLVLTQSLCTALIVVGWRRCR